MSSVDYFENSIARLQCLTLAALTFASAQVVVSELLSSLGLRVGFSLVWNVPLWCFLLGELVKTFLSGLPLGLCSSRAVAAAP